MKLVILVAVMIAFQFSLMVVTCLPRLQKSAACLLQKKYQLHALQTILQQRFTMRRYNLGADGRLTNLAKAMEYFGLLIHSQLEVVVGSVVAHAMASLMATDFSGGNLDRVLSAHLDLLAISPQAKQAIIPALLGMAKFTDVHARARSVSQPQAGIIEPLGFIPGIASATSSGGAHAGYQMYQQLFGSSSGSGYTIWYSSRSDSSIQSPPYWMLGVGGQWKALPKMQNVPTIMTGSFPFAAMGSQAGLYEQQSARRKLGGGREQIHKLVNCL
ncbi:hypothetical protein EDB85DRAFT_1895176 [Lactarius pseudohatsudake]|nr:hypothetical protein EDB85DRAFT_1895176 [Lactarius pseudohatsudake]